MKPFIFFRHKGVERPFPFKLVYCISLALGFLLGFLVRGLIHDLAVYLNT